MACLPAALAVFALWLRREGRAPAEIAAATAAFAVLPVTLLQALETLSENLYLLLSLGCLAATAAGRGRRGEAALPATLPTALLVAAACAGLAATTRTVGATLLVAFALRVLRARTPRAALLCAVALLPGAAWLVARELLGLSGGYTSAFSSKLATYAPEPARALPLAVAAMAGALAKSASGLLALFPGPLERGVALLLGALAAGGGLRRLRRGELDALYAALYLLVLLPWPFPSHAQRFLYPLVPVLLLHLLEGLDAALHPLRARPARAARVGVLLLLLAAPLPSLAYVVERHRAGEAREYAPFTRSPRWFTRRRIEKAERDALARRDLARAMTAVAEVVPPEACVWSVKPLELMWRSRRASYMPPPEGVPPAAFRAATERCDYFFLAPLVAFPYRTPFYPQHRLGDALEVVRVVPGRALGGVAGAVARRRTAPGAMLSPGPEG